MILYSCPRDQRLYLLAAASIADLTLESMFVNLIPYRKALDVASSAQPV